MPHKTSACYSSIKRCPTYFWNGERYFSLENIQNCPFLKVEMQTIAQSEVLVRQTTASRKVIDEEIITLSYNIMQCSYCQSFGHTSENCSIAERGIPPTCRNCAMQHKVSECNSTAKRCPTCFWSGERDFSHETGYSCPLVKFEIINMVE